MLEVGMKLFATLRWQKLGQCDCAFRLPYCHTISTTSEHEKPRGGDILSNTSFDFVSSVASSTVNSHGKNQTKSA